MTLRIISVIILAASLGGCALNSGHDTQADNAPKPSLWDRLKQTDDNIDAAMQRSDDQTWGKYEKNGDSWNPN